MPINFNVVYGFRLTINSVDSGKVYDYTQCISALSIKRPRAEPSQPIGWSGSCSVEQPLMQGFKPASLDNFEDPDPWKIGNLIKIYFYNILFATCYLTEYFYDEESGKGDLSFEGSLGYWNYSIPQKDYKALGFRACASTSISEITNRFVGYANSVGVQLSISAGLGSPIDVPPNFQGSCISQLQPYYGERMHWLYEKPNGSIAAIAYPRAISETNLILRLATTQVTNYKAQKTTLADVPKKKLIGSASVEKFQKCGKKSTEPLVTEEWDYIDAATPETSTNEVANPNTSKKVWVLQNRTTVYPAEEFAGKTIQKTEIEQAKGVVSPEKDKGDGTVVSTQFITKTDYFDNQNRLIRQTTDTDKVVCLALPEQFPGDFTLFRNAEKIDEEWKEQPPGVAHVGRSDGVLRYHGKTTTALFASGTAAENLEGLGSPKVAFPGINYVLAIKEKVTEVWEQAGIITAIDPVKGSDTCSCSEFSYTKEVRQRENYSVPATEKGFTDEDLPYWEITGLNLKIPQGDSKDNDTPPAFQTKKADCPTCTTTFNETLNFSSPAVSTNFRREENISTNTLQSRSELVNYLSFLGTLQLQRYRSKQIALPLPIEYVLNPTPFRLLGVGKRVYIVDSESISLGEDGIEFMFVGNDAGALSQEIKAPDYPFIRYYSADLTRAIGTSQQPQEQLQEAGAEPVLAIMPAFEFVLDQEV